MCGFFVMDDAPVWETDGRDWPNRAASRFINAGGLRWHLQQMGDGPTVLLLHGTGAATHSWRAFAPALAERFTVIAPDLPGHGFTSALPLHRMSLPGMAGAVNGLLREIDCSPDLVIGHSAGAAILVRMSLDGFIRPRGLISLNGALMPWRGLPAHIFSPAAKLMAANTLVARLFARRAADRRAVERLVRSTGSTLEPAGVDLYQRLIRHPSHVRATLAMMANWDLAALAPELSRLEPPLFLVVGEQDTTVPPSEARRVRERLPGAEVIRLPGLGHLAHEERPAEVAHLIEALADRVGLMAAD
ncbi:MAG: alpha/beta fold hydrolase [Thiocapsa sp.]|jgi:magnesium chelatase accessory protein|nr:alpha/beta fold hydrolase BchO [Thiocapsa sp.]MCG6896737.1 alpha/beta fold hydrolase [Thiocapsa sp.]MCG6983575.1 alpha/beta fold hydrolase [Thiocapsa sp.]